MVRPRSSISPISPFTDLDLGFDPDALDFELDNLGRFAGGDGAKSLGFDSVSELESALKESGEDLRTISGRF